jgi:hypothetical protein
MTEAKPFKSCKTVRGGRIIQRMNATYADISDCVKRRHGFVPKTCWIAHVKELNGLPLRVAPNRQCRAVRMVPLPTRETRGDKGLPQTPWTSVLADGVRFHDVCGGGA